MLLHVKGGGRRRRIGGMRHQTCHVGVP